MTAALRAAPAFADLLEASETAGRDPLQVQGPGGNSSLKSGDVMAIKASGTWLAEAREREIMVTVDLARLRRAIEAEDPAVDQPQTFLTADPLNGDLRPSIETAVHAVFDHPVVIHTHCVESIAVAAREDAAEIVAARLQTMRAAFVPYVKPGAPLARAILAHAPAGTDVLVLGNHGLVVGADTAAEATAKLGAVARALSRGAAPEAAPAPDLAAALDGTGWTPAPSGATQALAMDPARFALADGASLYPDHTIFLGPGVAAPAPGEALADGLVRAAADPAQKLFLAPGRGAAVPAGASPSVLALARALGDVAARIEPGAPVKRLTAAEEAALLNWDAEKYRQALEAARAGS